MLLDFRCFVNWNSGKALEGQHCWGDTRGTRKLAPLPGAPGGIELAPLRKERENLFWGSSFGVREPKVLVQGAQPPQQLRSAPIDPAGIIARKARPPAKHKQTAAEQHRETTKTEKALDQDSARTKGLVRCTFNPFISDPRETRSMPAQDVSPRTWPRLPPGRFVDIPSDNETICQHDCLTE